MLLENLTAPARAAGPHTARHSGALHWIVSFGLIGLFVVAALDSSVIPLPLPGSTDLLLLILVSKRPQQWILFAAIAVAGGLLGGYLSYLLSARGGEALMKKFVPARIRGRITNWVENHSMLSIGLPAMLPPPFPLTPFIFAAGALGMPRNKFLLALGSGRAVRYFLVAWLAQHYGRQIVRWWRSYLGEYTEPIAWTLAGITVVGGALLYWQFRRKYLAAAA